MSDETPTERRLRSLMDALRGGDASDVDRGRQAIALLRRWSEDRGFDMAESREFDQSVRVLLRACAEGDPS